MNEHEFCTWLKGYLSALDMLEGKHKDTILKELAEIKQNYTPPTYQPLQRIVEFPYISEC